MVRAIWRVFEEASSEERETMVAWCWVLRPRVDEGRDMFIGTRGLTRSQVVQEYSNILAGTVGAEPLTLEEVERLFTWNKIVVHDRAWKRLRGSFNNSTEWREFRLEWLTEHPVCVRCGQMDCILQVHHVGLDTLDMTVLEEGFLEGLKHPERFETVCQDCHYLGHLSLINGEKMLIRDLSRDEN